MNRKVASMSLPTPHGGINVMWFELNAAADATCPLGRDHGGPGAEKGIQDEVPARGNVEYGVTYEGHWLYRWMDCEKIVLFSLLLHEPTYSGIRPHIRAVSAVNTQHDVVLVPSFAIFEDVDKLMRRSVEAAEPS
jgi:hypothetical protein